MSFRGFFFWITITTFQPNLNRLPLLCRHLPCVNYMIVPWLNESCLICCPTCGLGWLTVSHRPPSQRKVIKNLSVLIMPWNLCITQANSLKRRCTTNLLIFLWVHNHFYGMSYILKDSGWRIAVATSKASSLSLFVGFALDQRTLKYSEM